jgi:hypothetical protein
MAKKTLFREAKGAGSATGKAVGKGAKKSYRYVAGGYSYAAKKVNPFQTWPDGARVDRKAAKGVKSAGAYTSKKLRRKKSKK